MRAENLYEFTLRRLPRSEEASNPTLVRPLYRNLTKGCVRGRRRAKRREEKKKKKKKKKTVLSSNLLERRTICQMSSGDELAILSEHCKEKRKIIRREGKKACCVREKKTMFVFHIFHTNNASFTPNVRFIRPTHLSEKCAGDFLRVFCFFDFL